MDKRGQINKILVTGGAGYIGSSVVRTLLEHGHRPVVFDNLSTGHKGFVPKGAPFVKGDLRNYQEVRSVFKKHRVDSVMHFASMALVGESVSNPLKYYENNVSACVLLLQAMQEAKVKKFIFSSSCATFGEPKRIPIKEDDPQAPTNPYGLSKLMIESILRDQAKATDLRYICLRYFNACGAHLSGEIGEAHDPETHLVPNILKVLTGEKKALEIYGDDYDTPDGTCVRDYIHIEDLASAHLLALEALTKGMKSEVFNLGNGNGYSVKEIVAAAEKVTGKKVRVKIAPRRPGDPAKLVASAAKAKKVLGWEPKFGLTEIIQTAWKWESR
jgi:UDP-glucose 4-epimerase